MLDFYFTSFNAYLSIEAEKVIDERWEVQRALFEKMGILFESVFANIRNTKSGSKYKAVISSFGIFIRHFFSFCTLLSNQF